MTEKEYELNEENERLKESMKHLSKCIDIDGLTITTLKAHIEKLKAQLSSNRQHYVFVQKVSRYSTTDEMGDDISGSNQAFDELILEARKIISQPTAQPTEETCKWKRRGRDTITNPHYGYGHIDSITDCPTCGRRIEVTS